VPARSAFDYAVIRVVPRVEREEFLNAGVILHCPTKRLLLARIALDRARLAALAPIDPEPIERQLAALAAVAAGDPAGGPIAALSASERFHWLTAPRSTVVQVSAVHGGLCDDPQATLEHLFATLVG
jgi:hypothetical protein